MAKVTDTGFMRTNGALGKIILVKDKHFFPADRGGKGEKMSRDLSLHTFVERLNVVSEVLIPYESMSDS